MTSIKKNFSSVTEYFFFDLTQPDLYSSVKEVLSSIEGNYDCINTCILNEFLLDLVRTNFLSNCAKDIATEYQLIKFQFIHEKNTEYKEYYRKLADEELDQNISSLIDKNQLVNDRLANALRVSELQKIALQSELHDLFSTARSPRSSDRVVNIEINLEKIMNKNQLADYNQKSSCCLGRVEVCNCLLF